MKSNCIAENIGIFSNLDKTVFVPYKVQKNKEYPVLIDNKLFAFINPDNSYNKFTEELKRHTKKEIVQKSIPMMDVINGVLKKEYDGIVFHDVIKTDDFFLESYVDYEDIERYKNTISIVEHLYNQINNITTHRVTLMNLMDKYFAYFGNINDLNNYIIKNDDATDGQNVPLLRIFSSINLANEYKAKEKIQQPNSITTLRNIIKELRPDVGVIIDINRSYETSICRELLDESVYQTEDSYNRDVIKDKMDYYQNLDEFYIVTNPCGDFDNGITSISSVSTLYNNKEVVALNVFESYSDAKKFVDVLMVDNIANVRAIGIVNSKEMFEEILHRAYTVGIKHIAFEFGTNRQLVLKIKDAYEKMYNKKYVFKKIDKLIPIKYKDTVPEKCLTDNKKQLIENAKQQQINKLIATGSEEELLYLLSNKSQKINEILNKNNKQPTEEVRKLNREFENILKIFLLKLMMKKRLSIVIDVNTKKPLLSSGKLPYLQIEEKYITSFAEITDFDICEKTIKHLREIANFVIFTNNNNAGCVVAIDSIEKCYKRIVKNENDRAKILFYLTYKCDLTINEAMQMYYLMFFNSDFLNEFKEFISGDANSFPTTENPYTINKKTAVQIFKEKRFTKKYMAYLEMAEQMCKENSDGSN